MSSYFDIVQKQKNSILNINEVNMNNYGQAIINKKVKTLKFSNVVFYMFFKIRLNKIS